MVKAVQRMFYPNIQQDVQNRLQKFMIETVVPETIDAVMSHKYIDKTLLLNLMLLFEQSTYQKQLTKYLTIYKKCPNKLNIIVQVGLSLLAHHGEKNGKSDLLNILNLCKWWFKINDPKIKYEFFFSSKPEPRLESLIKEEKVTLENLPEYCTDFALDLQHCYLKFLKT